MHIYAFGSVCRGDLDADSDVDLLAIVSEKNPNLNLNVFSIYSYKRIRELWDEGNPFAWHLSLESRLIFTADGHDFIRSIGNPNCYRNRIRDCQKFLTLFRHAQRGLEIAEQNAVFELSVVFLSIRNIATCFSLGTAVKPNFSRRSAFELGKRNAPISEDVYDVLHRARVLSTRGLGRVLGKAELAVALQALPVIENWMVGLVEDAKTYERVYQSN